MVKKILIVRHGETQDNLERRFQGWIDTPLNDAGHKQAQLIADRLTKENLDVIYTSDLLRARVTAEYIAKPHGFAPIITQSLREHNMGILQGWRWESEIDAKRQKLWEEMERTKAEGDWDWKKHSGESLNEHAARVGEFLNSLNTKHIDQTVVVVTHGATVNRIIEHYHLKPKEEYISYGNTSLTILEQVSSTYRIVLHNDTSHLAGSSKIVLKSNDQ